MDAFFEWFLVLYEDTGINLPFIYDSYDRDRMIAGFFMTVKLSVTCLFFSVIIGMIGACERSACSMKPTRNCWRR